MYTSQSVKSLKYNSIVKDELLVIISFLPFIQTCFHLFNATVDNFSLILKIIIIFVHSLLLILSRCKFDSLLLAVVICNAYMLIPTLLNDGYLIKFYGYFLDGVGTIIVIKSFTERNTKNFLFGVKYFCRLMIYINLILLLIYPNGLYSYDNGYIVTRYIFLGMDNQAAIIILTFMVIIYAIEKRQTNSHSLLFAIDIFVFFLSNILIWCATAIVAILVFLFFLLQQKFSRRKITIGHCVFLLFALFIVVVLLKVFVLFETFIVDVLGKSMTLSGRTTIWEYGIEEWLKNPLLGHGYQESEALIEINSTYQRGAHNQILNFLLHGGIISILCYLFIFFVVNKAVRANKNDPFVIILILGVLANFVMWTADTYGHLVGMYLLLGLLYYQGRMGISSNKTRT